jgi:putative ABC transport system permease protein
MLVRDLWHLRGQAVAAALVVACGVAAFVSMRGTYLSLRAARDAYYQSFRFADVFAQLKRAPVALAPRLAAIPGVATVRTRVVRDVTLDVPGLAEPAVGRLVSIPERRQPMLNDLHLRGGTWPQRGRPDEVIASEAFTTANGLGLGDRVGAVINGRWRDLVIVGVALSPEYIYEVGGGSIFPDNKRFGVLWMSEEALASAFDMDGAFNDVVVGLAAGAVEADVIDALDLALERWGGLGAYGREDQLSHRFISDEIAQNRITSTFTPAIFLGVASFLLHIVLSRLVTLQRTEIGVLKAFGYSNRVVGLHYLELAAVTVLAGVLLGSGTGMYLGTALTHLYREFYRFPTLDFHAGLDVLGLAVAISLGAAALGARGAVRRAAALPPAVAMRPEPPASFHVGLLERSGLAAALPSSARMIARGVLRRGWRSALSVLAIACAVGILVMGGFFLDAIRYLMRVQFEVVQRDDVTILFAEAESAGSRFEVARLPGVLRVEPFRAVPVRLRFEHRTRRTELTGLPAATELRRLVDSHLDPVTLPANGLVLTRALADRLGVAAGARVRIEVLEGARAVRDVPIAALVDEPVGVGAYMDKAALDRLLREQGALSGAYLAVDPAYASALNAQLKRMPAVRGAASRAAVIRSFKEILDRSLAVSMLINVLFACVIAFGVVYNGARIALSERGNELAALRVLGFSRREVAVILLGEQGVLTVAAVPVGFALGSAVCWLLAQRLTTELYRIPLVLTRETFGFAFVVVIVAALLSGALVVRRLHRLDLVAVLKTRE